MGHRKLVLLLGVIAMIWIIGVTVFVITKLNGPQIPRLPLKCPTINLVYTWVNGSDPEHIKARVARSGNDKWASPGNNRFRDLGGLLYSLRSAELYAPWINKIFIVTSGQVPSYLNVSNPRIELIFHTDIFEHPDKDLPTFNSNAIEGNFHNLPDRVGPCFIYLNDDMFFGNQVSPSDFWDEAYGQVLYLSSWVAPPTGDKLSNLWHRSILNSNKALDALWGRARRNYASHGPYFFSLEVLRHMYSHLSGLFNETSTHPFRHENDAAVPFLYNQWTDHYFDSYYARFTINHYMRISDDSGRTKKDFKKILEKRPKTVCMNDGLDERNPNPDSLIFMNEFFQKMFPNPSTFEKKT